MNLRIIYPNDEGGVAVLIPAPEARGQVLVSESVYQTVTVLATEDKPEHQVQELVSPATYRPETDEEFLARVSAKDVPPIVVRGPYGSIISSTPRPFKIVDVSDFPLERNADGTPVLNEHGEVVHDRTFRAAWEYAE